VLIALIWNRRSVARVCRVGFGRWNTTRVEAMAPQQQLKHAEPHEPHVGPLASIPSLGFRGRRRTERSDAWRQTVTQHLPESWPAARMALQARIAALDIEA
jgi:hypothetical protein